MAALLQQIGRRQVDQNAARRQRQAHGAERRAHPFAGLAHRLVRQPDHAAAPACRPRSAPAPRPAPPRCRRRRRCERGRSWQLGMARSGHDGPNGSRSACLRRMMMNARVTAGGKCRTGVRKPWPNLPAAPPDANAACSSCARSAPDLPAGAVRARRRGESSSGRPPARSEFRAYGLGLLPLDGTFARFQRPLTYDPDDHAACRVELSVDVASLSTERPVDPQQTMVGPDFMDVARFPSLVYSGACSRRVSVASLGMHGITRPFELSADLDAGRRRRGRPACCAPTGA